MNRFNIYRTVGVIAFCLFAGQVRSDEPATGTAHTIFGIVMELRSGTADVPVCLCDMATGLPLAKETYKPIVWGKGQPDETANEMAIVVTDNKGRFSFENVPEGKYRLVSQKWIGPYKGVFEEHGTVIQLLGSADEIVVPRPTDYYKALVALQPAGDGIVQFDQDVGNNDTFIFLSSSPTEFDPILGLSAMGTSFLQHLIGVNRMPLGKSTVIGVPDGRLYAFFFAPDNSPGFATAIVPAAPTGLTRVPPEPFVARWSNGRKTPPEKLTELMKFLDSHSLTPRQLLNIPEISHATSKAHRARMQELSQNLSEKIKLPEGESARVGDLLAVEGYRQLEGQD